MKLNEIPENQGGRGPLPVMENYEQAVAVARKEHDPCWSERTLRPIVARRWPFRHCPRYRQAKMDSPLVSPPPLPFVRLFTANNPSGHESPTDEAPPKRDGCEMDARCKRDFPRWTRDLARCASRQISANLAKSREISGNRTVVNFPQLQTTPVSSNRTNIIVSPFGTRPTVAITIAKRLERVSACRRFRTLRPRTTHD